MPVNSDDPAEDLLAQRLLIRAAAAAAMDRPTVRPQNPAPGAITALVTAYEERSWDHRPLSTVAPSSSQTYCSAVTPLIARASIALPSALESAASDALVALARFDARVPALLPPLRVSAPVPDPFRLVEAIASSRIENLSSTSTTAALGRLGRPVDDDAWLVADHDAALDVLLTLADDGQPVNAQALNTAHRRLLHSRPSDGPGQFRDTIVWVGGGWYSSPVTARFVPPRPGLVAPAMVDLDAFCARADLHPFIQAVTAHAQFETIHPYADGNGRIGRALVHARLRRAGVATETIAPFSTRLYNDRHDYYDALGEYRRGDPIPLIDLFINAVCDATERAETAARDLADIHVAWTTDIHARHDARIWDLLPVLIRSPVVNLASVRASLGVSQPTAHGLITALVDTGILVPTSTVRRNRTWSAPDVTAVLDDLAGVKHGA